MRNIYFILSLFCLISLSSCEKVIDVNLTTEPPRLVVDAALTYVKGTDGKNQSITLSTTTGFFDKEIPKVSGATIYINNSTNTKFEFLEDANQKGSYNCTNFVPVLGESYILTIIYKGETYKAQETLIPVNKIENVEQRADLGLNQDEYGFKINFQDRISENNFYIISYKSPYEAFPYYQVFDDQFFDGKLMFGLYGSDELKVGDAVEVSLRAASQRHFNYMNKLVNTASGGGGPFQPTPSSAIRGNVVNQTKESNFCLGFFSISEADKIVYTIK